MYDEIIIHGDCDLNFVWSRTEDFTEKEIESITLKGIQTPEWTSDTTLLATFVSNINGNSLYDTNTISGYVIQRQKINENSIKEIAITNSPIVNDYTARATVEYKYSVIPMYIKDNETVYGETVYSDIIKADYDGIYMIGLIPHSEDDEKYIVDENNIWRFRLDIEQSDFKTNNSKSYEPTVGRFPIENNTNLKYITFPVTTLLGDVDCKGKYQNDNIDFLEKWRAFCDSDNLKLFKDDYGNIYPCAISNHSEKVEYNYIPNRTIISFDVTQTADVNDISVYGEV